MAVRLLLKWWYGPGLKWVWQRMLVDKLHYISEVFSVTDMVTTLFAPFRQTYVGKTNGVSALQAFTDRTVSRAIGFVVRMLLLLVALITASGVFIVGVLLCIIWPILPLAPALAIVLAALKVGA